MTVGDVMAPIVGLAIDAAILTALHMWVKRLNRSADEIEAAPHFKPGPELMQAVKDSDSGCLAYASVEGEVMAVNQLLASQHIPGQMGVMKEVKTVEHKSKRLQGVWSDVKNTIQDRLEVVPFVLRRWMGKGDDTEIQIQEPTEAKFLLDDLTTTHDFSLRSKRAMEEFWAHEFLSLRNVSQAVIQNMKDDKIDCEAVVAMTDENLKMYLLAYGDRVALMAYARIMLRDRNVNPATSAMPPRREGAGVSTNKHSGNKRARRASRRVELGWWNRDIRTNIDKQVRAVNGGGTHHLDIEKCITMEECKETAKSLFFPDGCNKYGKIGDFELTIRDFKGDPIEAATTVEEKFASQHMKTLRLYLYSSRLGTFTPRVSAEVTVQDSSESTQPSHLSTVALQPSTAETSQPPTVQPCSSSENYHYVSADTPTVQLRLPCRNLSVSTSSTESQASSHSSTTSPSLPDIPIDSEFDEAGMPTVLHRQRNNLSLRRRRPDRAAVQYTEQPRLLPVIDIIDSEDGALQMAIDASIAEIEAPNRRDIETMPLSLVLGQVQAQVDTSQQQEIVVNRRHVLDSALRALRRKHFNLSARMYVKFSGEMGLDHGGPSREFFRLALQELCSSSYFEGSEANKFFAHNLQSLEKEEYKLIGNLVALSIVHDGPGLNTINPSLANMMLGLEAPLDTFNLDHLPNPEVKDILQQLKGIETVEDLDSFKVDHGDWLVEQGYCGWRMKIEDKGNVC